MALPEKENGSSGEGVDSIVQTCALGGFSESSETRALLSSLLEIHGDIGTVEATTQKFLGETIIIKEETKCIGALDELFLV